MTDDGTGDPRAQSSAPIIFGAGGHARVIASLLGDDVMFVVRAPEAPDQISQDAFFASVDEWRDRDVYLGIGDNAIRDELWNDLQAVGITPTTIVSPRATVDRTARLGAGVMLSHGAVVCANAVIEDNVIVNTMASVDHDCRVGQGTHLTTAVHLGGGVRLGAMNFLGMGVIVTPGVTLGDATTVMAGAVVVRDFDGHGVLGGSPARPLRQDGA